MYLGIDLGTSEVKLLLLDTTRRIVATAGAALTVSRPQPLWSEQAPDDWWSALDMAMRDLATKHACALSRVRAIGLSGQMHGAVVLDESDHVLRPAILWNDGRSGAQCAALETAVPALHTVAGNLAMPGFTAPKLLWLREHEPDLFARIRCVLLPKDWLRWRLTGCKYTDCSDASGTLWLDVAQRQWSDPLLEACGLSRAHVPEVVEGNTIAGRLLGEWAARWGLPADIPVAGGGGDNAASAVGIGAANPGEGFVSLGTSGVIFVCSDRFMPNRQSAVHAFCHALPQRWHQMSVMLSAASALRWGAQLTGHATEAEFITKAQTLIESQQMAAPLFLPYLAGERTPHNDPHAKGVLFGLTHEHGPAEIAHAVVEGVSFGLVDGFTSLDPALRRSVQALTLVGGGARSTYWAQLLASLLDRPLLLREGSEHGGALGAARLAWLADGGAQDDICDPKPVRKCFTPDAYLRERLASRYARYQALYPLLRELWRST